MEKGNEYRVGNYVVVKNESGGIEFINVLSFSSQWGLSVSTATNMGAFIEHCVDRGDCEDGLEVLFSNFLSVTSLIDVEFQKKVMNCIADFIKEIKAKEVDDDESIVKDLKTFREMEDAEKANEEEMNKAESDEQVQSKD